MALEFAAAGADVAINWLVDDGAAQGALMGYALADGKEPPPLGRGSLVAGREHDGRIRVTRWPNSEPATGLFNVSGLTLGRFETPQPIGHSRDLTVMYVDLAMLCRHQGRHDGFLCCE
jgi:hypothetical protein